MISDKTMFAGQLVPFEQWRFVIWYPRWNHPQRHMFFPVTPGQDMALRACAWHPWKGRSQASGGSEHGD